MPKQGFCVLDRYPQKKKATSDCYCQGKGLCEDQSLEEVGGSLTKTSYF